jgi:hypothetical protein
MTVIAVVLLVVAALLGSVAVATLIALRTFVGRFDASVRAAVIAALAEDREREMAEARSFWAEQEARAAEDAVFAGDGSPQGYGFSGGSAFGGDSVFDSENLVLLPAPRGYVDDDGEMDPEFADALRSALEDLISESNGHGHPAPSGPTAPVAPPAPAGHPSLLGFVPQPAPTPEWTDLRLNELVDVGTVLHDVRPGPTGTLDVYVFEDETTLCIAPGDPAAAARLREAVGAGAEVRLLGSSRLPGAHALTFALGATGDPAADETVYILADRVVASL